MFLALIFISSSQPVIMAISLMFMTLYYSVCVYKLMGSYWFGYALMLVMLSGVLVLFTYMASLIPNESFEMVGLIFISILLMLFIDKSNMMYYFDFSYVSIKLWLLYVGVFNLFLVGFLLSIMVMVVWLSYSSDGAVRVSY